MFALEENKTLKTLIDREFNEINDIQNAINIIKNSRGIQKAKDLAEEHMQIAQNIICELNSNEATQTLLFINNYIINRIN